MTHRTDKKLANLMRNLCSAREHSFQFFLQFFYTVKMHSLTYNVRGPLNCLVCRGDTNSECIITSLSFFAVSFTSNAYRGFVSSSCIAVPANLRWVFLHIGQSNSVQATATCCSMLDRYFTLHSTP
jgi:hypothetical protein